MGDESTMETWLPVLGRSLAYLALRAATQDDASKMKSIQQKAQFLEKLGLSRSDAAALLGTTAASITELHRRAKAK